MASETDLRADLWRALEIAGNWMEIDHESNADRGVWDHNGKWMLCEACADRRAELTDIVLKYPPRYLEDTEALAAASTDTGGAE
jgi:hypothetical protein